MTQRLDASCHDGGTRLAWVCMRVNVRGIEIDRVSTGSMAQGQGWQQTGTVVEVWGL